MLTLTKVIAYIVREQNGKRQLLVFTHRDYPDAGLQVPAGTVEEGEEIEAALHREVWEETELRDLQLVRKVAAYNWTHPDTKNLHISHVYLLHAYPIRPTPGNGSKQTAGRSRSLKDMSFVFSGQI